MNNTTKHFLLVADNDRTAFAQIIETVRGNPNDFEAARELQGFFEPIVSRNHITEFREFRSCLVHDLHSHGNRSRKVVFEAVSRLKNHTEWPLIVAHYRRKIAEGQ